MAEVDDILQRYGEGYRDPRLGMDSADYSTRDVLPRMHEQPWFTKAMRHLASYLPTDDREDRQRGRDEPWMNWWARTNLDSGAGPALTSAVKGGLNTGANWLEGKPEIGPDTLAPLGMAAMGMPLTRAAAMAKPQAALERPERPVKAAMKIGDNIYEGYNHGLAISKAEQALGPEALWSQFNRKNGFGPGSEGFVTNKGRYVSRQEAQDLLGQYADYPGELHANSLNEIRLKNRINNPDLLADSSRASLPGVLVNAAEQNAPIRAYHGMNGPLEGGKFDPQRFAGRNHMDDTRGVFLTTNPETASGWAEWAKPANHPQNERWVPDRNQPSEGTAVVPADVSFRNPLHAEAKGDPSLYWYENRYKLLAAAERGGHDGIVISPRFGKREDATVVALQPNTVRSATTGNMLFSSPLGAASLAALLAQYRDENTQ